MAAQKCADRCHFACAISNRQSTPLIRLGRRVIILDELTSVLTPDEADDVLGLLAGMARAGFPFS